MDGVRLSFCTEAMQGLGCSTLSGVTSFGTGGGLELNVAWWAQAATASNCCW